MHFDGGANNLTREPVSSDELRVHGVFLILEQKETKKTKKSKPGNRSACDFPAIFEVGTTWARPRRSRRRQKRRLVSVDLVNHTPRVKKPPAVYIWL